jgi:hypothetical protein
MNAVRRKTHSQAYVIYTIIYKRAIIYDVGDVGDELVEFSVSALLDVSEPLREVERNFFFNGGYAAMMELICIARVEV